MKLEAVFFDCDGVIAETEKDGHLVAFNMAFQQSGLDVHWGEDLYRPLLKIGGGKERLCYFFEHNGWPENALSHQDLVNDLHTLKSSIYQNLISKGHLKVRPGIVSLMYELALARIPFGICTTRRKESVEFLIRHILPKEIVGSLAILLAGDMVEKKKPAPDVYLLAAERLHVKPDNCVVIEDSAIGLTAALKAGMHVIVSKSYFTTWEDFEGAIYVTNDLSEIDLQFIRQLTNKKI